MPRSLSEPLVERLLHSFPPTRAYRRADWAEDAMPNPVAHFLDQLLSHHSRREARRLRRARSDWVDYDHPEMEQAVRTFFEAVEAHTQVPADEWEDTLHQSARHTTAYLVRPVYVLNDFVFGGRQKRLRLPEVLWRMNFFGPYAYLRKSIKAFAKKKDIDRVGPDQYDQFLHRVDAHVTADFDAGRWLRLLRPLFTIARRATDRERLRIELLQTFFAEKEADAVQRRLKQYENEGHGEVGPKALYRLIKEAQSASSSSTDRAFSSPDPAPTEPSESEPASDDEIWGVAGTARPEGSEAGQPTPDNEESTPLWKQFQQGRTPSSSQTSDAAESDTTDRQEPLWARFRRDRDERLSDAVADSPEASEPAPSSSAESTASEPSEPASSPSSEEDAALERLEREILGTSNPPHRAVYVRQLFDGDKAAYKQVLQRLRMADSWGEASQIIAGDIFRTYKVNIYSDAAVHFTNAVESRFRSD